MRRLCPHIPCHGLIATLLVAIVVICACTPRPLHEPSFRRARAVMDSCPECALAILDSIHPAELRPGIDSARYILLHALAEDKAHRLEMPDSLLRSIIPVFKRHNLNDDQRTANYLLGTSLDYQERYSEAIGYLIDAEYLIDDSTNPYHKGLIYNELAECCNATLNGELAMKYIKLAYDSFIDGDKPLHAAYALYHQATFYNNNEEYENAIITYKKIQILADSLCDDNLKYAATAGIGYSHFGRGEYTIALNYFHKIPASIQAMDTQGRAIWAEAERKTGNPHIADSLARILKESGDYRWIYALDPNTIPTEEIITAYHTQDNAGIQLYLDTYRDKFPSAIERNFLLCEEIANTKLKYNRWLLLCLGVLAIIGSAYSYTLIRNYRRRLKEKEDTLLILSNDFISFSREQQQRIDTSSKLRDAAITATATMLKERINLLHDLIYSYSGRPANSKETFKDITRCVNQLLDDLRKPEGIAELERIVNICYADILIRLVEERPDLNKEEIRLFTYVASGLDTCILLEIYQVDSNVFRKRKSRLRIKLANISTPSQQEYLRFF